jgi:Kef-type K+ transport system membrane component KefB
LIGLALILVVARLVGNAFMRFGQPRVVGEIVAGVLLGPTILGGSVAFGANTGSGWVNKVFPADSFAFINMLGQVGLVFFMCVVGLELDQRLLKGRVRAISLVAVATVFIPLVLGFVAAMVMSGSTWTVAGMTHTNYALFLGVGLAVSAFPVMARILQEKQLMTSKMGALGIGAAAIVTVLMFLVFDAVKLSAANANITREMAKSVGWLLILIAGLMFLVRPVLQYAGRNWKEGDAPPDGLMILTLASALGAGLACDYKVGISPLVGGFLAGALVPFGRELADAVRERLAPFTIVVLIPIFLATSGLETNFRVLRANLLPGLLFFLLLMVVAKWGVGYAVGRSVGLKKNDAHVMGVLLNCRGLLILVVGQIGLTLGVLTPAVQVVFVIGAIVTTLMTGPLVDHYLEREEVPEPEIDGLEALPSSSAI